MSLVSIVAVPTPSAIGVDLFARHLPKLKNLVLSECYSIGNGAVTTLANSCSELQNLQLRRVGAIDDSAFRVWLWMTVHFSRQQAACGTSLTWISGIASF